MILRKSISKIYLTVEEKKKSACWYPWCDKELEGNWINIGLTSDFPWMFFTRSLVCYFLFLFVQTLNHYPHFMTSLGLLKFWTFHFEKKHFLFYTFFNGFVSLYLKVSSDWKYSEIKKRSIILQNRKNFGLHYDKIEITWLPCRQWHV